MGISAQDDAPAALSYPAPRWGSLGCSSVCSVYRGRMGPNCGLENKNLLPVPEPEPARSLVRIPVELTRLVPNDDQCLSKLNVFRTRRRTSVLVELLSSLPSLLWGWYCRFSFCTEFIFLQEKTSEVFFKLLCAVCIYEVILCNRKPTTINTSLLNPAHTATVRSCSLYFNSMFLLGNDLPIGGQHVPAFDIHRSLNKR